LDSGATEKEELMATSEYFSFALSVSFHPYSIHIFILILLLSEAKVGKTLEPSRLKINNSNWYTLVCLSDQN
jgi:hypothetical protein